MQVFNLNNTNKSMQKIIMRLYKNLPREVFIHQSFTAQNACQLFKKTCEEQPYLEGLAQLSLEGIRLGALYHDSGKILIPREILLKKGKLSEIERTTIYLHAIYGGNIAVNLLNKTHYKHRDTVWAMAEYHHERWDGLGYPEGLKGTDIPISARICSIADSYEAMTSSRPYNIDISKEYACSEIVKNAGTQFDPILAKIFIEIIEGKNNSNNISNKHNNNMQFL